MKITIKSAENGYLIIDSDGTEVFEGEEKEALPKLLYAVAERMGYFYDKFGKENLKITFDGKGHKID